MSSEDTPTTVKPTMNTPTDTDLTATAAVANTTAATTAIATSSSPVAIKPSQTLTPTIRIYVDTADVPRPVIVNYRQLYKQELKKLQGDQPVAEAPLLSSDNSSTIESANDIFYSELLKKAQAYNLEDDDMDDDGSDEENLGVSA